MEKNMTKKKRRTEPLKFEFDGQKVLNPNTQLQVLTLVGILSAMGLKTLEDIDWESLLEKAPLFRDIVGDDKVSFIRYSYACLEIFQRWQQQETHNAVEEGWFDEEVGVHDMEDALKILDTFQKKQTQKKYGWSDDIIKVRDED